MDDVRWWEAHAYRTIVRLARKDAALNVSLAADGRLEIHRTDGVRLVWYRMNAAGEPIAFGAWDNERGTVFGPLVTRGGGGPVASSQQSVQQGHSTSTQSADNPVGRGRSGNTDALQNTLVTDPVKELPSKARKPYRSDSSGPSSVGMVPVRSFR